ncbi:MAG: hypothetical protein JSV16_04845 [Candidatus Hydrogenedentota bacterium]|nr:MAG: hypothetical protein JSV16_04845 [Candidatus Hydrogenedentota bacterium]
MAAKIEPSVIQKAFKLYEEGKLPVTEICKECGISWGSLHNYLTKSNIVRRKERGYSRIAGFPRGFKRYQKTKEVGWGMGAKKITFNCPGCMQTSEDRAEQVDFYDSTRKKVFHRTVSCSNPTCNTKWFRITDLDARESEVLVIEWG